MPPGLQCALWGKVFPLPKMLPAHLSSQYEEAWERVRGKAERVRKKLGDRKSVSAGDFNPFPPRPKGMHHRTYARLERQDFAYQERLALGFEAAFYSRFGRSLIGSFCGYPVSTNCFWFYVKECPLCKWSFVSWRADWRPASAKTQAGLSWRSRNPRHSIIESPENAELRAIRRNLGATAIRSSRILDNRIGETGGN